MLQNNPPKTLTIRYTSQPGNCYQWIHYWAQITELNSES